ncbi:MAG: PilZ domain-containing protein [Hyphomicrobium sp.]
MFKAAQIGFERRAFGRKETHISAQVRAGHRIMTCIIKDISEGGALLEFEEEVELPARVWLSWTHARPEIVCDVRHVRKNRAGVQFARPMPLAVRPSVDPVEATAQMPALPPRAPAPFSASVNGAAALVAQRRHALKALSDAAAPAELDVLAAPVVAPAELSALACARAREVVSDIPRDVSGLFASIKAELARNAADASETRLSAASPLPLPAIVPGPLAARCYARPQDTPASLSQDGVVAGRLADPPLPMAAGIYAAAFDVPPRFEDVPGENQRPLQPLAARAYAEVLGAKRPMPPLPLPAKSYGAVATFSAVTAPAPAPIPPFIALPWATCRPPAF